MLPGQIQPTFQLQHNVGQPSAGQPMQQANAAQGQPELPEQPVNIHGASWQPPQQQQVRVWKGGFKPIIDIGFLKSPRFFVKIAEFVALLAAWVSLLTYAKLLESLDSSNDYVKRADFFKGITIFSWLVVIVYTTIYLFSLPETFKCCRPSTFTMTSVCFWFGLLALLLASTGNLVQHAVVLGKGLTVQGNPMAKFIYALIIALTFGFLSCILFVVDMVLNYKEFQAQRAQEQVSPEQEVQGPPQRRVWDINHEFLRSSVFKIKVAEMVLLLAAWACTVKYLQLDVPTSSYDLSVYSLSYSFNDPFTSIVNVFKGYTVFVWVMVILLVLTVVFSFDKICGRSSSWTMMIFVVYSLLTISLMACCGRLSYDVAIVFTSSQSLVFIMIDPRSLALMIGLFLGNISWMVFIGDLTLIYKLYKWQKAQEWQQQRLVLQERGIMTVPQGAGNQQFNQPAIQPRQEASQYHGQQPVAIGVMPPSGYNPLQQWQQPTQ